MRRWVAQIRQYEPCRQVLLEGLQAELEETKDRLVTATPEQFAGYQQQAQWLRNAIRELQHDG